VQSLKKEVILNVKIHEEEELHGQKLIKNKGIVHTETIKLI